MKLLLKRIAKKPNYTIGKLYINEEYFCDTIEDLMQISPKDINLGSIAIVIDGMQVFIAGSNKQWNSMTPITDDNETAST